MRILLPNTTDRHHLESVKNEMDILGAPRIKAVWIECYGAWVALEGSHRIMAAKDLGMVPVIEEVEWSEDITTDEVVPGELQDNYTIQEFCDRAYDSEMIEFEE